MTNRNPDSRNERPEQVIPWAIQQWVRGNVHTSMPGVVLSYDPATKRARVQPAIRTRLRGTPDDPEPRVIDKPPIVDVPVQQTATGDHMVHHEVGPGDVVLLMFAERGLDQFKAAWGSLADPAIGAYFDMRDAVAVLWGVEDIAPVRSTGWLVQQRSGDSYMSLDGDTIRFVSGNASIVITPGEIRIVSGNASIVMTPDEILIDAPHVGTND